ncbi:hypothetical protein T4B_6397 [Trichinella pseudospiralis]|uniref:Uncharacterized protein n=1 Tax=Trichinella pseudospiralis TaxID=6337 RepID=A0A0V1E9N5_TRIPS|nr:hypothetical protein T4A_4015 [Trichinella pseudospiralis]KRZ19739.1 hypothetical protein T4B_6397 [Trichinella pseudospiralis]KRZ36938.1 hypothetical protein T4C_2613 [Trichinella pseudospiralis]
MNQESNGREMCCQVHCEAMNELDYMDGTEKRVCVIGKSRKPRCFCNKDVPLPYCSSIMSWMTSTHYRACMVIRQGKSVTEFADIATVDDQASIWESVITLCYNQNFDQHRHEYVECDYGLECYAESTIEQIIKDVTEMCT